MDIDDLLSPEYAVEEAMKGNYGPAARLVIGELQRRMIERERDFIKAVVLETMRVSVGNEAALAEMSHKEYAKWICDRADAIMMELNRRAIAHTQG
jgi:hypothetical protein